MNAQLLTFVGLSLTLAGACLLFFYGLPRKKYGNVLITGENVFIVEPDAGEAEVPPEEWQPVADRFQEKAKRLNSLGFALVAAGTLLQMLAVYF